MIPDKYTIWASPFLSLNLERHKDNNNNNDNPHLTSSQGLPERVAEGEQAEEGDDTKDGGHGLAEADGAGDRGAA